jgi:hypothetical protein
MSVFTATVFFIACHGPGPADHFATYAEALTQRGHAVQIHATGAALKKLQERNIEAISPFSLENLSSEEEDELAGTIAKACSKASVVITDVGHAFDAKIQKALSDFGIPRFAYYDNPEPFVPGGYSSMTAEVIKAAGGVWFANENLATAKIYSAVGQEIDFEGKKRLGIGYYPVAQAEKIAEKRKTEHESVRSAFLRKHGIEDKEQKVWVYFGGNNEEYFSKAFPKFLSFLDRAPEDVIIVVHQHPGAKAQNRDAKQLEGMSGVFLSDFSSDEAQILADAAFYYQTSMGPQFVLAGIPTVQVGHETYEDVLVRNNLAPSVTSAEGFAQVPEILKKMAEVPKEDLLKGLGIREDWPQALERALEEAISLVF